VAPGRTSPRLAGPAGVTVHPSGACSVTVALRAVGLSGGSASVAVTVPDPPRSITSGALSVRCAVDAATAYRRGRNPGERTSRTVRLEARLA
jgi:hypothetical protein